MTFDSCKKKVLEFYRTCSYTFRHVRKFLVEVNSSYNDFELPCTRHQNELWYVLVERTVMTLTVLRHIFPGVIKSYATLRLKKGKNRYMNSWKQLLIFLDSKRNVTASSFAFVVVQWHGLLYYTRRNTTHHCYIPKKSPVENTLYFSGKDIQIKKKIGKNRQRFRFR